LSIHVASSRSSGMRPFPVLPQRTCAVSIVKSKLPARSEAMYGGRHHEIAERYSSCDFLRGEARRSGRERAAAERVVGRWGVRDIPWSAGLPHRRADPARPNRAP
jgi:hypothetical protein